MLLAPRSVDTKSRTREHAANAGDEDRGRHDAEQTARRDAAPLAPVSRLRERFHERRPGCRWPCARSNTGSSSITRKRMRTSSARSWPSAPPRSRSVCNRMRKLSSTPARRPAQRPARSVSLRRPFPSGSAKKPSAFSGSARSCAGPPFKPTRRAPPRSSRNAAFRLPAASAKPGRRRRSSRRTNTARSCGS